MLFRRLKIRYNFIFNKFFIGPLDSALYTHIHTLLSWLNFIFGKTHMQTCMLIHHLQSSPLFPLAKTIFLMHSLSLRSPCCLLYPQSQPRLLFHLAPYHYHRILFYFFFTFYQLSSSLSLSSSSVSSLSYFFPFYRHLHK